MYLPVAILLPSTCLRMVITEMWFIKQIYFFLCLIFKKFPRFYKSSNIFLYEKSKTLNLAFDITPAKYVTGLITEKGVCEASEKGLKGLFKWAN